MPLSDELAVTAARRYIRTYEMLTGRTFEPGAQPTARRVETAMRRWLERYQASTRAQQSTEGQ